MIQDRYKILENREIAPGIMMMRLEGEVEFYRPGQFVNIAVPGFTLRRPISVCDWDDRSFTIVYAVVGGGTERMSLMLPGESLDMLAPLGTGFDPDADTKRPVLLGGGVGCPPLYGLARRLLERGVRPTVVLGFNSSEKMMLLEEFRALGLDVYVATLDGSCGTKGFVTDAIREKGLDPDYFYACGPTPMLRAVCLGLDIPGEVSLEARMGCGFGACVCCSVETVSGSKRICMEGPAFRKEELIWK